MEMEMGLWKRQEFFLFHTAAAAMPCKASQQQPVIMGCTNNK